MAYTRKVKSPSPRVSVSPARGRRSRSLSRSRRSRSRSRSRSNDAVNADNPGNNLYVTGLSTRVTNTDLEKYFSSKGKVVECHLVTDPRTKESRGFGFVTMDNVEDANRCIKHLNRSVLEGRLITVEKAKRKCGWTPTPGRYQGLREKQGDSGGSRRRSRSYSPRPRVHDKDHHSSDRRERTRSPYRRTDDLSDHRRRPRDSGR